MVPIEFQSTHPHGVRPLSMHIYKYNDRVSIHAPTRGATQCRLQHQRIWLVSIHAPTRGATSSALRNISVSAFQSTHPHGVRLTKTEVLRQYRTFQSTHPHGVRRDVIRCIVDDSEFQSTHPHGVRHVTLGQKASLLWVSIHAPTRGATVCKVTYYKSIN